MRKTNLIAITAIVLATLSLSSCMLFVSPTPAPVAAVVTVPAVVPAH